MIAASRIANPPRHFCAAVFIGLLFASVNFLAAEPPPVPPPTSATAGSQSQPATLCEPSILGSPYIPVDSWVYPAVFRLYSIGYLDHVFLGMRPWTRASLSHMLENTQAKIEDAKDSPETEKARELYRALMHELAPDTQGPCGALKGRARVESAYTVFRGIGGTPLDDSFHLGSTIVNDYGRPFANGFNDYSGLSGYATAGRFTLYVRGEFQHAPSAAGYSTALASTLSCLDFINVSTSAAQPCVPVFPQATIPLGPIASKNNGRLLEAYVSYQLLNHVISFGKQDEWLGPAKGGSFAFSNNAQNFYAFQINRIEPLYVPLLSRVIGPLRYDFLIGPLRGHTLVPNPAYTGSNLATEPNVITPGDPWVHVEKISFRPTDNLEFGFERTAIFGGEGHEPVNLHSFLRSFFSTTAGAGAQKNGRTDPGARFGAFDFSYRLPFARNWLTLYSDGEVHDDVSPIDAPRRAAWRPGLYLSHVPGLPRLSLRTEAAWTDPPVTTSSGGRFMYWEFIEKQGYTNQGQIFGDWTGREAKSGQAWATWHLSGDEWIQAAWRHQKAAKDFIPGGTTLNDVDFQVVKRIGRDFAIDGKFKYETWKAPIYLPGQQNVTATTIRLIWYPQRKVSF